MKIMILVPSYNEAKNIASVLRSIRSALPVGPAARGISILVVDDGSSDGTAREAKGLASVYRHRTNKGYGEALKTGYAIALFGGYDAVIQLDADGQHDPRHIPEFIWEVGLYDVVVGSRFACGPSYRIPFFRRSGMRVFGLISSLIGICVKDTTSGYRAYSRKALAKCLEIPWKYPDANLLIALHRAGMSMREIPVTMYESRNEKKSMHSGILGPIRYVATTFMSIVREV